MRDAAKRDGTGGPVMERLRTGTRDLHERAETRPFQRRMVRGDVTRDEYADWLGQMLLVHRVLEDRLRRLRRIEPALAIVRPEQAMSPALREDLLALGRDPDAVVPLPATTHLLEAIARAADEAPLSLLGFHYVLLGSTNGNRIIAQRLAPALGLSPGGGMSYLDSRGSRQREMWGRFRRDMDAVGFSSRQAEMLLAAARRMFAGIAELGDALAADGGEGR